MILEFVATLPEDTTLKPILISGSISTYLSNQIYLTLTKDNILTNLYEIKFDVYCSPFKEVLIIDNLLSVGHEEHFYLFNLITNENILRLEMNGYFGHLYYNNESFYVADARGIYCINKNGKILWSNIELAIDGVIINEFSNNQILGSGEFDPPGGWIKFSIDKNTGKKNF